MKKLLCLLISFLIFPITYNALNSEQVDNLVEACKDTCYRVKSTMEAQNKYEDIIFNYNPGKYYIYYADEDNVNTAELLKYINANYISKKEVNKYKFSEFGIYKPIKYEPVIGANYILVNKEGYSLKGKYLDYVDSIANYIVHLYKDETDINKILMAYNLVYNIRYDKSNTLGAYNVLVEQKGNERNQCAAFQLLMEKFGFESYIVDTDYTFDEENRTYNNSNSYIIIKLNSNWYIISFDGNLLKGTSSNYYSMTSNLGIQISDTNYPLTTTEYEVDYNKIFKFINDLVVKNIDTDKVQEYFEDEKIYITDVEDVSPEIDQPEETKQEVYLVVGAILVLVTMVIILSVKKK